jgi:uncharacterized protein (TIGR03435 family)
MNAVQFLAGQPWVERLGATLLHFLWQGLLVALVYLAARRYAARSNGTQVRYLLACGALALMAAAPVLTWFALRSVEPALSPVPITVAVRGTASTGDSLAPSFFSAMSKPLPPPVLPWLVGFWLTGSVALWLRLIGGWIFVQRLRSRLVRPAPVQWQRTFGNLKERIRVSCPVPLLISGLVRTPVAVGWLRPVVLMPVGALAGLPAAQVEALLLHELAHIRRHDYFVNVLQSIVEALLFYHPAVWWVSGHIRAEREQCCDDLAVSISGDVLTYARALAEMASHRGVQVQTAMAATSGSLAHRIARLLRHSRPAPRSFSAPGMSAAAILLASASLVVWGQPAARPQFEVASIKPSVSEGLRFVRPLPGRLRTDAPVKMLLQNAYGVQEFQIVGGPDWMHSDKYAIEAKAHAGAGRAEIMLMLQSLLEERFQLKIHRETREMPVYALAPARSGLKLPAAKADGCANALDAPPDWAGGRMQPPAPGGAPAPPCGSVRVGLSFDGAQMQGGKIAMPELVRTLSMVLDRAVIDRTGFTGLFDVHLDFQADEITPALPPPPPDAQPVAFSQPSIPVALQEQLGLRLESTRGPVEMIVIDRLERPSAN